jgi:hypothetical protein
VGADHGVAFQPGEPIRGLEVDHFAEAVHPELMWVPLFVRAPRAGAPHLSDANVETIDVLPTVADVLGVDIPWRVDGVSAFGPGRRTKDKAFFQSKVTPFGVTPGERTTVDGEAGWRLVLERSLPGGTNDQLAPYRVGPSPHLVGRPTDELRSGSETDVVAEVDDPGFVRLVERQSPRIPALVAGRLHGPVNPDDLVVVSVDDVIATVSPSFPWEDDEHAFASLLPEPLLDDGENDISIHLLSADGIARPTRTG